jgi:lysophospholipase L1-like esterase
MANNELHAQTVDVKTYLALGDSYTIGEQVDREESYPVQLISKLRDRDILISDPMIIAKTGWTTDELLVGIEKIGPGNDYDLVTLLIGVNNQYRGRDIENYRSEFELLLRMAISFAGNDENNVIVISIPDYGVTPFGRQKENKNISREIDLFNSINKEISDQYQVHYVNVTKISRTALEDASLTADDGH